MTTPTTPEEMASLILARLRPFLPSIAGVTKNEIDTRAWVAAWAIFIKAENLSMDELKRGIENIGKAPPNVPFSPSVFLSLCKPKVDTHQGEAYKIKPAGLPEPKEQREARRMRGMEACKSILSFLHKGSPAMNINKASEHLSKIDPGRKKVFHFQ